MNLEVGKFYSPKDFLASNAVHFIYKLFHRPTGHTYVGITSSIPSRMRHYFDHDMTYRENSQIPTCRIKNSKRKDWEIFIVDSAKNRDKALKLEKKYIDAEYRKIGRELLLNSKYKK